VSLDVIVFSVIERKALRRARRSVGEGGPAGPTTRREAYPISAARFFEDPERGIDDRRLTIFD
jgi:hypothetical protein